MKPTHYAVVPTHGNCAMTQDALADLWAQDIGEVVPIVVNDAGIDNTERYLSSLPWRRVVAVNYTPHKSVAYKWNRGIGFAFATGAKHVLVVNNDVRLRPDTYRLLAADGGGFVTCVGVSPESGKFPGSPRPDVKRPHPDFSLMLIRREVWERVGPFDEAFEGAYAEDWDYHIRMHKAGVDAYCIDVPFLHYAASTIKSLDHDGQVRMSEQAQRNRDYFERKWGVKGGTPEYYAMFGTPPSPPEEAP